MGLKYVGFLFLQSIHFTFIHLLILFLFLLLFFLSVPVVSSLWVCFISYGTSSAAPGVLFVFSEPDSIFISALCKTVLFKL